MNPKLKKTVIFIGFAGVMAAVGYPAYKIARRENRYVANLRSATAYVLSTRPSGFQMAKPEGPDNGHIIRYVIPGTGTEICINGDVTGHGRASDAAAFIKIGDSIVNYYRTLTKEDDKDIRCTVETTIDRNGNRSELSFKGL